MMQIYYPTQLALRTLLDVYGSPSHIIATAENRTFEPPSEGQARFDLTLVYLSRGVMFSQGGSNRPELRDTLPLFGHYLVPPTKQAFAKEFDIDLDNTSIVQPWRGQQSFLSYCQDWDSGRICRLPDRSDKIVRWIIGFLSISVIALGGSWWWRYRRVQVVSEKMLPK
jgi:hypothetical protein